MLEHGKLVTLKRQFDSQSIWTSSEFQLREKVNQICCGNDHCLAVTHSGKIFSWGIGRCGAVVKYFRRLKDDYYYKKCFCPAVYSCAHSLLCMFFYGPLLIRTKLHHTKIVSFKCRLIAYLVS